ncbi:MAG: hypothetical protein L6R38_004611 [Xanthoria sp. 2 TBL-2021]|nr:MAG: hypothetical protein L6R38_004611 [Xanthoria sp. 2 TBL-2021]
MAKSRAPGTEVSGASANKTFERTLKTLDSERIPPEFQNDFEDYVSSDDHGSSTHQDKVGRSSDLSRSGSDDSGSIDDSDGEYQPEHKHVNIYHHHGLDPQELNPRYTPDHAGVSLRDIEIDEGQDDFPENQEDVDVEDEDSKASKKHGQARGKKLTAKPVGIVRYHDGRPAVYHQDIREQLIKDAARLGRCRHHLARGKDKLDITAFHPAYAESGPDRQHWPKILFQYAPTVSNFLHTKPPIWQLHDGRVVIDCNNDAMNDYPEIPVTLARNADSWLMLTCMRLNNHITIQDFRGRMPGDRKMSMADPLGRNRISMNMTRFRKFGCCLTWNSIRNVDTQREYLDKKLPRRCIRLNSTESFRKLFPWEVAESELQDAGRFLKRTRARQKDVSQARSRQVYKRKRSEFEQLKKTFDRLNPDGLDDYDTEDEEFATKRQSAHPGDGTENDAIKAEAAADSTELQLVKPGKRRRIGQGSLTSKDTRVLPGDSSPDSKSEKDTRPMCPRRHKEYAGFLSRAPSNTREAQLLYDLLRPTRVHYEKNTELVAPETYGDECYKCQLSDLQNAMIDWHESYERFKNMEPAKLIGLQYVENGELYWNTNWRDAWFGHQPMVNPEEIF